jgi:hypothetical protein
VYKRQISGSASSGRGLAVTREPLGMEPRSAVRPLGSAMKSPYVGFFTVANCVFMLF